MMLQVAARCLGLEVFELEQVIRVGALRVKVGPRGGRQIEREVIDEVLERRSWYPTLL